MLCSIGISKICKPILLIYGEKKKIQSEITKHVTQLTLIKEWVECPF